MEDNKLNEIDEELLKELKGFSFSNELAALSKKFKSPMRTLKRGTYRPRRFNNRKITEGRVNDGIRNYQSNINGKDLFKKEI